MTAPDLVERLVHPLSVHAVLLEDCGDRTLLLMGERDEKVFSTYEVVSETVRLGLRATQCCLRTGSHEYLRHRLRRSGHAVHNAVQARADRVRWRSELCEKVERDPFLLLEQRRKDVLRVPLRVAIPAHDLLRLAQHVLRLLREIIWT